MGQPTQAVSTVVRAFIRQISVVTRSSPLLAPPSAERRNSQRCARNPTDTRIREAYIHGPYYSTHTYASPYISPPIDHVRPRRKPPKVPSTAKVKSPPVLVWQTKTLLPKSRPTTAKVKPPDCGTGSTVHVVTPTLHSSLNHDRSGDEVLPTSFRSQQTQPGICEAQRGLLRHAAELYGVNTSTQHDVTEWPLRCSAPRGAPMKI